MQSRKNKQANKQTQKQIKTITINTKCVDHYNKVRLTDPSSELVTQFSEVHQFCDQFFVSSNQLSLKSYWF